MVADRIKADAEPQGWIRYLKPAPLVVAITGLGFLLDLRVAPTNLAMLYLLATGFVSYRWGFGPAVAYSLIGTLTFDFFFIPPYESFAVTDFWYLLTAVSLLGIALFISILTRAVRRHAVLAERREAHTATLCAFMKSLASTYGPREILSAAAAQIRAEFGLETAAFLASEDGRLETALESADFCVDESLRSALEEVFVAARNGRVRGEGAILPLQAGGEVIGVMALSPAESLPAPGSSEELMLNAMVAQAALALKRSILEKRSREADRERERAQRAKAEAIATLAGGLAHDLNNLLTGVIGNASLLADSLPEDHPGRNLLGQLNMAGERAAHIVAQVLSYAGKGRFFDELVDLSTLVAEFVSGLPPVPANIELSVTLEDHLPLLEADRDQLRQLIGNLYLNAVEAIGQATGRIVISTYHQDCRSKSGAFTGLHSAADECICLTVTDSGCGIEESIRAQIFDPFFSTKFVGRGLGLSASEGIMRSHQGVIRFVSRPGKGSTFTCLFPVLSGITADARGHS